METTFSNQKTKENSTHFVIR